MEFYEHNFMRKFYEYLGAFFVFFILLKPGICLSLSILATVMIIIRIGRQAAFQIQHNRRDFLGSLRVATVILFQTLINLSLFAIEFVGFVPNLWQPLNIFGIDADFVTEWRSEALGLTDRHTLQALRQCRILIESIIVLSIMTGYREAIFKAARFAFQFLKNPKKSYQKIAPSFTGSRVTSFK